jgi:hypothetical protein
LANDSPGPANEAGQTLTVTSVSPTSAQGGAVTLVGGQITYTPPPNFNGTDSFSYTIEDNGTTDGVADPRQATGTVSVVVAVSEVNDPPTAGDDTVSTAEDTQLSFAASDLLANDSPGPPNEAGQTLTVTGVSSTTAAGGTVTFENGQITYTPPPNFNGTDSFTYTVTDDGTTEGNPDPLSSGGTVFITVDPVNDLPTVVDESYSIDEDGALVVDAAGGVLANDFDVDADPALNQGPGGLNDLDPATLQVVSGPSHGQVSLAPDGSFVYTPDPGFGGESDSFTYAISDTAGGQSFGTVTIDVYAVADAPTLATAGLPATSVPEGSTIQFTLTGGLNDPDGSESLAFEVNNVPEGWILTSPDATVVQNGNDYLLTPQPGASTVTVVLFAPDDGDEIVEVRAVATESGSLVAVAEARTEVVHTFTAFNVAPTITVSDGEVDSLGFVTVTVTVFDPGADDLSFQIDWQDGTTTDSGIIPGAVGGQTYTAIITHQYLFTPDSAVATGEIEIEGLAGDDDGGLASDLGVLSVPARVISATRIDTAPVAPPLLAPTRAMPDSGPGDRSIPAVNTRPVETGSPRSEAAQAGKPTLSLRVVSPAGEEGDDIDLPLTTLGDLRSFFRRLPDGHYRLYLTERGGTQRRLVLDVFVRRGLPADPEEVLPRGEFLDPPQPADSASPAGDRASQLDRLWERRGASEDWPRLTPPDQAAEVDARMERLAAALA